MRVTITSVDILAAFSFCIACICNSQAFHFSSPSEVLGTADGRVRGARNRTGRDFVLGGLFAIHNAAGGGGKCGEIRREKGLERVEAMLYAVDLINQDDNLLPGLSLGYDIRDTCSSENIGLDESIDLVITNNSQLDIQSCQEESNLQGGNGTGRDEAPTTGVVGASNSGVSVPVAGLLRLFTTPQISYASSSALLNNRDRYGYFFRTTPPDTLQARAMVDILRHFNWTYISTIYSKDTYGVPGIERVHALAEEHGICVDLNEEIADYFTDVDFAALAQKVDQSSAQVIILFSTENDAIQLFQKLQPIYSRNFTWIASDFWSRSTTIQTTYASIIAGMIGITPQTMFTPGFHDYFSNLTLDSNARNPWFEEWYSALLGCSLNRNDERVCQRNQSVPDEYETYSQGLRVPLVIDAVYAFGHALDIFLVENCEHPLRWFSNNRTCLNQARELNGTTLLGYLQRVDFVSPTGHRITFNNQGNAPGSYEIVNFMYPEGTSITVGKWNGLQSGEEALQLQPDTTLQFAYDRNSQRAVTTLPESHCSRCQPGQYQTPVQSSCCGTCNPCLGQYFSNWSLALNCSACDADSWGNAPLVGSSSCVALQQSFLHYGHPYSVIITIIAIAGLILVAGTVAIFARFWTAPPVKSSSREQMVVLLVGIATSYISAFFFVSPPTPVICGFQRWSVWTCFAVMFGALLVKVVRVARIFLQANQFKKLQFIGPWYQIIFTVTIISVQWLLLLGSTIVIPPEVTKEVKINAKLPNDFPTVVVTCVIEHTGFLVVSLAYQSLLILLSTVFGMLSFKYPHNYNDANYIAVCSTSVLVIWIAFIITFFATSNTHELQNIAVSLAVVMTGYAVLLPMFGPRIYLLLVKLKSSTPKKVQTPNIGFLTTGVGLNTQYELELDQRGNKYNAFNN